MKTEQLPPAKVSPKLKAETIKCADIEEENLSEYVRKSVEERNKRVLYSESVPDPKRINPKPEKILCTRKT